MRFAMFISAQKGAAKVARGERTGKNESATQRALAKVMTDTTADVMTLATLLGCGKNQAYAAAKAGHFGAFKMGAIYHFPTAVLREVLHLEASPVSAEPITEAA